ncbi:copper amine oxidase N-terminal domain-containing protein [Paenibacillus typhae]|uniref:copper amine oxidase N-terminal domain-containing protein n=1 Tax=Paenibacillus typhae TaxID=1174501 RepID=UPI001C8D07A1|nr:copper amine oxidase N-terminal domain-containing protein [Paenibacillus typhae]MBY0010791.1 copper amine oxidase N-terminal domain-containing protein [Paenibacillus typhae]
MKILKKFTRALGFGILIIGLIQSTPSIVSAAAAGKAQSTALPVIRVYLNNNQITSSSGAPSLVNGTVMLPLDSFYYISGLTVKYDERTKVISIENMFTKGSMKSGERTATVNGKKLAYSAAPQQINKQLYVPLRFVNDAIGGTLDWKAASREAVIGYPEFVGDGRTSKDAYFINGVNGAVYKRDAAGVVHAVGVSAAAKLEPGYIAATQISSVPIAEDADLVTIQNSSGEPSINLTVINLFVKKGVILRQSAAHYWQFYPDNLKTYNGNAVMNDGHTVRLIAPDASVKQTWNISKLAGTPDVSYAIEAIGENYLVVRSSSEGLLTLIDLEMNKAILLYNEFGINPTDMPGFKDDGIRFTGSTGNGSELQFEFTNGKQVKTVFSYTLGKQ